MDFYDVTVVMRVKATDASNAIDKANDLLDDRDLFGSVESAELAVL